MKSILILSLMLAAGVASATQPSNNGNNQGGNGYGGAGGSGVGIGIAGAAASANAGASANVKNSNSISNRVSNSVRNTNANLSSNRNNNLNVSSGGAGGLGGAGGSSNSGGNTMRGGDVSTGAVTQGSVSLTIEGAQPGSGSVTYAPEAHRPVSTATAPGLAAVGNGSCMGSTSVGGQGASVGLSFGTTWKDDDCNARYDAQQLAAMGFVLAAKARLCSRPDIKASLEAAGDTCPVAKAKTAAAPVQAAPVASATSDPFIAMSGRSYPSGAYANK